MIISFEDVNVLFYVTFLRKKKIVWRLPMISFKIWMHS